MWRSAAMVWVLGCAGGSEEETGSETGTTGGTTPTGTTPACVSLTDGTWEADGAAFGMPMQATLTFDAAACSFTLTNWDMNMGSEAQSGSLAGDAVTLDGDPTDYWSTCTGTATETDMSGICAADGAAWTLTLQ